MATLHHIPPAFEGLVDDAAVFPPGSLPLPEAVAAHRGHRRAWYAPLVGPFLCPASRLGELHALAADDDEPLGVSVVVDTGTAGILEAVDFVAADSELTLRGVEVPLRGDPPAESARRTVLALDTALGGPEDDEPACVEIPLGPGWQDALDVVAEAGYRAKLRTGGAEPGTAPPDADVAAFVIACLDRGVQFKFTAGLHHAVRRAVDGGHEHGFLNVLLAVTAALDGADQEAVGTELADERADDIVARTTAKGTRIPAARRWYTSFGSCSVQEPLDELIRLRLIETPGTVGR